MEILHEEQLYLLLKSENLRRVAESCAVCNTNRHQQSLSTANGTVNVNILNYKQVVAGKSSATVKDKT